MKLRGKNPATKELITELNKKGSKAPAWKAVAKGLNRPRRKSYKANLCEIEKHAKPKETIIVPGFVLGTGEIKKGLTVAALKFSQQAREKIEKSGGKCLSIEELAEKNPKGSKIRIMG
jgi:large subunit ribosomal protein L18e